LKEEKEAADNVKEALSSREKEEAEKELKEAR
jgi:hypothetical protein